MNPAYKIFISILFSLFLASSQLPHSHEHDEVDPNPVHQCHVCKAQSQLIAGSPNSGPIVPIVFIFSRTADIDLDFSKQQEYHSSISSRAPPSNS